MLQTNASKYIKISLCRYLTGVLFSNHVAIFRDVKYKVKYVKILKCKCKSIKTNS